MRCKRHPFQAGGGVCATCLRERLVVLAAAQNNASSSPPAPVPAAAATVETADAAVETAASPAFPRSVSPYLSRRKSDSLGGALKHHPNLLFFRTPQVGPTYGGSAALEEGDIGYEKRRAGKFSVFATLFGNHHRSENNDRRDDAKERKNRSWIAGIMSRRRKKHAPDDAALHPSPPPRRSNRAVSNRGLSPERVSHGSGEESSSPPDAAWRASPSPMRKTPCRRRQSNNIPSGFAFCLSPLVQPTPGRRHPDPGTFSSELRPSPLHNVSSTTPITRCRSRKLADGGRFR